MCISFGAEAFWQLHLHLAVETCAQKELESSVCTIAAFYVLIISSGDEEIVFTKRGDVYTIAIASMELELSGNMVVSWIKYNFKCAIKFPAVLFCGEDFIQLVFIDRPDGRKGDDTLLKWRRRVEAESHSGNELRRTRVIHGRQTAPSWFPYWLDLLSYHRKFRLIEFATRIARPLTRALKVLRIATSPSLSLILPIVHILIICFFHGGHKIYFRGTGTSTLSNSSSE